VRVPSSKQAPPPYHHGDLRSTLLAHGIELARAGGPDAVSLRDVQRRAGVSNSAAYRHYADRDALVQSIAEYASAEMATAMEAAMGAVPKHRDPAKLARARFRATGAAYLAFAIDEPGLFATVFASAGHHNEPSPEARGAEGLGPYQLMSRCLDEMVAAGALRPENRAFSDVAAWSAVHGLSVLLLDGPLAELGAKEQKAAIKRLLDVVEVGTT
jgi:AcrR family transcriptional regulator